MCPVRLCDSTRPIYHARDSTARYIEIAHNFLNKRAMAEDKAKEERAKQAERARKLVRNTVHNSGLNYSSHTVARSEKEEEGSRGWHSVGISDTCFSRYSCFHINKDKLG